MEMYLAKDKEKRIKKGDGVREGLAGRMDKRRRDTSDKWRAKGTR